jgi:predicted amidophosphoribosyltransferase
MVSILNTFLTHSVDRPRQPNIRVLKGLNASLKTRNQLDLDEAFARNLHKPLTRNSRSIHTEFTITVPPLE